MCLECRLGSCSGKFAVDADVTCVAESMYEISNMK